jgi:hypothetical protein
MVPCRLAYIEGCLLIVLSHGSLCRASKRQLAVLPVLLATGRQEDMSITRRLAQRDAQKCKKSATIRFYSPPNFYHLQMHHLVKDNIYLDREYSGKCQKRDILVITDLNQLLINSTH